MRSWTFDDDDDGNQRDCWTLGAGSYIKEAVRTCERLMEKHNLSYSSMRRHGRKTPFSTHEYRPELNFSNYCDYDRITVFQNVIGILR